MGFFNSPLVRALGLQSTEAGAGQMPPDKQAKALMKEYEKDPKADKDALAPLQRSMNMMELFKRTKNKEQLLEDFRGTRKMAETHPLVWLNLTKFVKDACGDRVYEFADLAAVGAAAVQEVQNKIGTKSATEQKMFETLRLIFEKKELFSQLKQGEAAVREATQKPKAANDNYKDRDKPTDVGPDRLAA
jgi:hypothetical protein